MKETITEINKQIFYHRLYLLWHSAKYICYWIFVILWVHSPGLLGMYMYLARSHFYILMFLSVPMFLFNCRLLAEPIFTETNEKLTLKKNEIQSLIYDKIHLKHLIKKSLSEQLNHLEYNELYNILIDIGIEEKNAEELIDIMQSNDKI
jgi:hypothetical protein